MAKSDFLNIASVKKIGFKSYGKNIQISKTVVFLNPNLIILGNNVRIDANTVITASSHKINIGSYVHIGVGCYINGSFGVHLSDFVGLSSGAKILSSSDDYSGNFMTNPTVPKEFTNPKNKKVILHKYVNIGANSLIMPGVNIFEGSVVGVFSFVPKNLKEWGIYFGIPVKRIGERKKNILKLFKKVKKNE